MKRSLIGSWPVLAAALLLAACGGGGGGSDAGPGSGSGGRAELAQGIYQGSASNGEGLLIFVVSDGRFWARRSGELNTVYGLVHGNGDEAGALFSSLAATSFNIAPQAITPAALSLSIPPRQRTSGTLRLNGVDATLDLAYGDYPLLLNAPGNYTVLLAESVGAASPVTSGSFSVSSSGAISGSINGGCQLSGRVSPRGDVRLHDIELRFSGSACPFSKPLEGMALIEAASVPAAPSARSLYSQLSATDNSAALLLSAVSPGG